MDKRQYIFDVPPGLGDIGWCHEKIYDLVLAGHDVSYKICGDEPRRSIELLDILPGIRNLGYGGFYANMLKRVLPYDTDLSALPSGHYAITLNPHLEAGGRLDKAFPKQTTHYHYEVNTTAAQKLRARDTLAPHADKTWIGFYCSSHHHRNNLGLWLEPDWDRFLRRIIQMVPNPLLIAFGAKFDDKTLNVYTRLEKDKKINIISTVGENDVGSTYETLKLLDYFVSFPSGLSVYCDVVKTPNMYWYWHNMLPHCANFPTSYADPESLQNKRHIILPYGTPEEAWPIFEKDSIPWLFKRLEERRKK